MELFNYLLRASICMALGYLPYVLFFKKLTFFSANRVYLLVMVAASLIIPAVHIRVTEPSPVQHITAQFTPMHNLGAIEAERKLTAANQGFQFNWLPIAGFAYSIVCLIMLVKLFYGILKIVKQAKLNGVATGKLCIVHNHNANNSSFFNIIFLHAENTDRLETEQVLSHEQAHVRLLHSADNLFIETVKVFFWFNPCVYFIARALKQVHEYEVDRALKNIFDPEKYASLLLRLSTRPAIGLSDQFSACGLKTRIIMLFKPRSSGYKKWCYLISLPVLLATGYWFAIDRVYGKAPIKKNFVLVLDAGHGGTDWGARGIGGHLEKDLALLMVKEINLVAEQRGIRTILTRSDDQSLDNHSPKRANNEADAFISIHVNSQGTPDPYTNGTMIIVSKNSFYPLSKKLAVNVETSLQQIKGINTDHEIGLNETQNIYVLRHNKMPAVLVELGFITNKNDMRHLLDPGERHEIAEKIIDAVAAYGNAN